MLSRTLASLCDSRLVAPGGAEGTDLCDTGTHPIAAALAMGNQAATEAILSDDVYPIHPLIYFFSVSPKPTALPMLANKSVDKASLTFSVSLYSLNFVKINVLLKVQKEDQQQFDKFISVIRSGSIYLKYQFIQTRLKHFRVVFPFQCIVRPHSQLKKTALILYIG